MIYFLDKDAYYMNPMTGSVAKGEEWLKDFQDYVDDLTNLDHWESWGGDSLTEVKKVDGEWEEVK